MNASSIRRTAAYRSAVRCHRPDGLMAARRTPLLRDTLLGDGGIRLRGTGNLCARLCRNARSMQKLRVEDDPVMLPGEMGL
ncbi:hypothetical protein ACSAM1_01210 [Xanthomonas citri pv. bilvae]|uniref:hypothetical protein n=1 Tax=Xanthomonas citri TaxID=346 RepID=UPI00168D48FD